MKRVIWITFLGVCIAATMDGCRKRGTDTMNDADREFIELSARTSQGAIDGGNLAVARGHDPAVIAYGQTVAGGHVTLYNELKLLAQQRNYNLPVDADLEQQMINLTLKTKFGGEFDSIYMRGQVFIHLQMVGMMQDEIDDGNDPGLKAYAEKHLARMDLYKKRADTIVKALKN